MNFKCIFFFVGLFHVCFSYPYADGGPTDSSTQTDQPIGQSIWKKGASGLIDMIHGNVDLMKDVAGWVGDTASKVSQMGEEATDFGLSLGKGGILGSLDIAINGTQAVTDFAKKVYGIAGKPMSHIPFGKTLANMGEQGAEKMGQIGEKILKGVSNLSGGTFDTLNEKIQHGFGAMTSMINKGTATVQKTFDKGGNQLASGVQSAAEVLDHYLG